MISSNEIYFKVESREKGCIEIIRESYELAIAALAAAIRLPSSP